MKKVTEELMKRLAEAGKKDAFDSLENFRKEAEGLGYAKEQIEEVLEEIQNHALEDEELEEVSGGLCTKIGRKKYEEISTMALL